jgi:hypothetical protein
LSSECTFNATLYAENGELQIVRKIPPHDSWISLAPGVGVTLNEQAMEEWHRKTAHLRTIRGTVLANAFEIEFSLDLVISGIFFPKSKATSVKDATLKISGEESKTAFEEIYLRNTQASFSRKIETLRKMRRLLPELCPLVPEGLVANLDGVRDYRNRFAHYPVTFEPAAPGADTLTAKTCMRRQRHTDH